MLANLCVFTVVLATVCISVYSFSSAAALGHLREKLRVFAASVVASIDSGETMPDLIGAQSPEQLPLPQSEIKLQWFNPQKKLISETGKLPINEELELDEEFELQESPHALLFACPAVVRGQMLGYLRVGQSLNSIDSELETLSWNLIWGSIIATVVSSLGIFWLVKQTLQPIEASFLRLKQFTDDASHELRSPIMAIKSNCSVVLHHAENLSVDDKQRLQIILDATTEMTKLTDDLLVLARADQNIDLERNVDVSINQLLDSIVSSCESVAAERSIDLRLKPYTNDLYVHGDQDQLRSVFANVIHNALGYTHTGGKVSVEIIRVRQNVVVMVSDNGIGIAAEDLPKVFDRFWRADRARSHREGGTGLGLAIAKAITQLHHGQIQVESELGTGTRVTVSLPLARSD